jgi:nitrate reductase NapAB chaperone NapD
MDVKTAVEKIKELVRKGNVSKIVVRRKGEVLLSIPVNVGVVGAVIGITAAKWAMLAAALATVGFGCTVEVVKEDGEIVNVLSEEDSQKIQNKTSEIVEDVKDVIDETFKKDE